MRKRNPNEQPMLTWVEVRDVQGRTRMEARWSVPSQMQTAKPHAA
jgi:hypothetical protein